MDIIPISAFSDNYIWMIVSDDKHCLVVDPGDAEPVLHYLKQHQLKLTDILITHHHHDHTGGVNTLVQNFSVPVYGPKNSSISHITHALGDEDKIYLKPYNLDFTIQTIPGHTRDHISYYADSILFCGDTLFSAGCGRLFEGTPKEMYHSLQKLMQYPDETRVYCAHEYTEQNLNFALTVDSENLELKQYLEKVKKLRAQDKPSLPSTIAIEKATNPFLRANQPELRKSAEEYSGHSLADPVDVFAVLRTMKDHA